MRVLWVAVCFVLFAGSAATTEAQRALQATHLQTHKLPEPLLTLRPQPGLRRLAQEVAAVLELRTGQRVEVGDPPPPGLLEAVPAGHVAMARQDHSVVLVLGAYGGRSLDAIVQLVDLEGAADARAVALAAEALNDAALDTAPSVRDDSAREHEEARDEESQPVEVTPEPAPAKEPDRSSLAPKISARDYERLRDEQIPGRAREREKFLGKVEPLVFVRMYAGASTASTETMGGVGTGLGLCVKRHCLFVAGELPLNTGSTRQLDVRYRYPTFLSGFYTRPFSFGKFTPGASLGFLTRLGHFEADMGMGGHALDTDLGARGSLELAWEIVPGLDLMSEGGLDVTLDRQRMVSSEDRLKNRGDRLSPWLQGALRYRP